MSAVSTELNRIIKARNGKSWSAGGLTFTETGVDWNLPVLEWHSRKILQEEYHRLSLSEYHHLRSTPINIRRSCCVSDVIRAAANGREGSHYISFLPLDFLW